MSGFSDFLEVSYQSKPPKPKAKRAKSSVVGTAHVVENTLLYREERERIRKMQEQHDKYR
jgi:hypothetical protein